jgi:predicted  nucleic acid-binding Zn-ribbon protein
MREILFSLLFIATAYFTNLYFRREELTLEEVDKKVTSLSKNVKKIDSDLKSQEQRMGAASTQASQAQALLHSAKS